MGVLKSLERALRRAIPRETRRKLAFAGLRPALRRRAPVDLVVHVGAHWAEDAGLYEDLGAGLVLWIEADPDTYAELNRRLGATRRAARHLTENALVSAQSGTDMAFNRVGRDGDSSSVHTPTDTLRTHFPTLAAAGEVLTLRSATLSEILARHGIDVLKARRALLVLDVQGHEHAVLDGASDVLDAFALIKCEVSRLPLYAGGARFEDLDATLTGRGFRLVSHARWRVPRHGDVLYARL